MHRWRPGACATLRRVDHRSRVLFALAAALLLLTTACDRNIEPYVEGEVPRRPDVARILADTGARVASPGLREPAAGSGASIRGRIELAPELAGRAVEPAVLYLMARPADTPAGPPVAVKRLDATSFPVLFEIGSENMMAPDSSFEGNFHLSVRLDRDGEAITRRAGDLVGTASRLARPGSSDVVIVIDRQL